MKFQPSSALVRVLSLVFAVALGAAFWLLLDGGLTVDARAALPALSMFAHPILLCGTLSGAFILSSGSAWLLGRAIRGAEASGTQAPFSGFWITGLCFVFVAAGLVPGSNTNIVAPSDIAMQASLTSLAARRAAAEAADRVADTLQVAGSQMRLTVNDGVLTATTYSGGTVIASPMIGSPAAATVVGEYTETLARVPKGSLVGFTMRLETRGYQLILHPATQRLSLVAVR